jgi:hypothetical protein
MGERLHLARARGADLDETLLAVAALNVFMMGEALAGAEMLAAVDLPTDALARERLRTFFARLISEKMNLASEPRRAARGRYGRKAAATRRRAPRRASRKA